MATVIDELLVNLGFDADPAGANKFSANLSNVIGKITKVGTVMTAVTSVAAGFLGKSLLDTASQFEKFETQLTTIEGSSAKAKASLDWIADFAEKTPYDIAGVTDAFVKLKAYGLDPASDGLLTSLGNTASAMGKSLDQSIEMMADAVRGESERLKEFGIVGSKNKNEMTYSYTLNGESLQKTVSNDAVEIQKALQEIFDEKFAGGMDAMSKTWDGQLAKMGDTWTALKKRVSDRGIFDRLKYGLGELSGFIDKNRKAIDEFGDKFGDKLVDGFDWLEDMLFDLWDSALWARDAFKSLDSQFNITGKGAAILGGIFALLAANIAGLMAAKMIAGITSLARGLMLLFSPLALIGVGLLAIFLIAEDIYGFLNGKDSIVGSLIKDYPIINDVIALIMKVVDAISAIWTDNEESLGQLFNAVGELIMAFEPLVDLVLEILPEAFAFFLQAAIWVIGVITDAVGIFAKIFTGLILFLKVLWQSLFWSLRTVFEGFFDIVTNKIKGVMTLIGGMAKSLAAIFNGDVIEGIKIGAKAVWEGGGQILSKHSDDYIAKKDGSASFSNSGKNAIDYGKAYTQNSNQSTVTQHINVASANEAAIVARNGAAQGTRQINYGYQ